MALGLMCGRRELLRLVRPQRQFHSVAGPRQWSRKALTAGLQFPAGRCCGRPHYVLLAAPGPRGLSTSAISFAEAQVRGPLTAVASPVAEHRLQTRRLSNHGSQAQPLRGM
ncbi:mitochondrial inner membrane protein OXA1L [Physeter macrocephalus]|uniref:Mitochondrial inner membrane protein OXA1L n=1 Tax=Physeter macrocephalus TaxID=9755 RepID=A0A9W2WYV7_PHYMC|nr:mitochondrial inner membrane protein OXA1L [Physeter catodon]